MSMAEIASAFVSLLPSAKGFGSKLESQVGGEVQSSGKRMGSSFGKMFAAGAAVIGGAALIGGFLKDSIGEAREAQKVGALTASTIKATGGAANVTAKQVSDLAGAISAKTGIDDETIQSGQNMLLTFKNIRNEAGKGNDIFNQTSKTLVDLSAAMGSDPKNAAIQLGKALNDPVKGVTALSRVGVTFTEQQKAQIGAMVAAGNAAGAQKVVLKELNSEFGGAAAAQATSGEKAGVALGNLKEQIGTAILPAWDTLLNAFVRAAPVISSALSGIGPLFSQIGAFFAPVVAQVQGFFSGGSGGGILAGIQSFAATVRANFLPVLQTMVQTFTGSILPAITALAGYLAAKLFPVFKQVAGIIQTQVVPIVASLAQWFYGTLYPAIIAIVTSIAHNLKPVFDQLVATYRKDVLPAIEKLLAKFREWQPTIQKVVVIIVKVIGFVLKLAAAIIGKVLPVAIKFAGFLISRVVPAVAGVISIVVKIISKVIAFGSALINGGRKVGEFAGKIINLTKQGFSQLITAVAELPGKIIALGSRFLNAGKSIIGKFVEGLKGAGGVVSDIAGNVWDAVRGMLNSAIGKINAALSFHISIPGPDINFSSHIPMLAKGTDNFAGGLAIVGEKGPELVNLPRGSQVIPNNKSFGKPRGLAGDDATLAELRAIRRALARVGVDVGRQINGAATAGYRGEVA